MTKIADVRRTAINFSTIRRFLVEHPDEVFTIGELATLGVGLFNTSPSGNEYNKFKREFPEEWTFRTTKVVFFGCPEAIVKLKGDR